MVQFPLTAFFNNYRRPSPGPRPCGTAFRDRTASQVPTPLAPRFGRHFETDFRDVADLDFRACPPASQNLPLSRRYQRVGSEMWRYLKSGASSPLGPSPRFSSSTTSVNAGYVRPVVPVVLRRCLVASTANFGCRPSSRRRSGSDDVRSGWEGL
jgi:hypothetical protein